MGAVILLLAFGSFVSGLLFFWVSPWFAILSAVGVVVGFVVAVFWKNPRHYPGDDDSVDEYEDYYR